jgi:hypothetical protein
LVSQSRYVFAIVSHRRTRFDLDSHLADEAQPLDDGRAPAEDQGGCPLSHLLALCVVAIERDAHGNAAKNPPPSMPRWYANRDQREPARVA